MINNDNDKQESKVENKKDSSFVDLAYIDMQCHILIKDKDTNEILVNKRG